MPSEYVTLVSAEGYEFVVQRASTEVSPVIKRMLDPRSQFAEAQSGVCNFPEISTAVLEKVVEYFQYWYSNRNKEDVPDLEIPTEQCLELLMAADYLGMDKLG